jgi:predicted DNA-binding transcriptional regulator AlpA
MSPDESKNLKLVPLADALQRLGNMSRPTFYRRQADKDAINAGFPRAVKVGARTAVLEGELDAYIAGLAADRDQKIA